MEQAIKEKNNIPACKSYGLTKKPKKILEKLLRF